MVFHTLAVLISRRRLSRGWFVLLTVLAVAYVPQFLLGVRRVPWTWNPFYIPRPPSASYAVSALQDFFGIPPYLPVTSRLPGATGINLVALFLMPVLAAAGLVAHAQASVLRPGPRVRKALPALSRYAAPVAPGAAGRGWGWLPVLWFGSVFVLPFVLAQIGKPLFLARYMAGALPVYCWLIAGGIIAAPRAALRVALAAACVVCSVPAIETMKAFPMRAHWRECAQEIMNDERSGDRIVLCPGFLLGTLRNSYRGGAPITYIAGHRTDEQTVAALNWSEPPQRVWLVVARAPRSRITRYFMRRPDYRLVKRRDYPPYGSFDYPPAIVRGPAPIILMLFEHVAASDTPAEKEPGASGSIYSPATL